MRRIMTLICLGILLATCSVSLAATESRKFDEYGNLNCEDEMARLDQYAVALQSEPESIGYVFVYAGRHTRRGEAGARLIRIKNYLVKNRGLGIDRLRLTDGGYRDDLTVELYALPRGAIPPEPVPTVDPKEVKFKRGRIKKWELSCDGIG